MDSLNHGLQGYIIGKAFNLPEIVCIGFAVEGALPDLIGYAEKIIKKDWNVWNWYNKAHQNIILRLIPMSGIHIWEDSKTHSVGNRWWKLHEGLKWEVLTWLMCLVSLLIILRI